MHIQNVNILGPTPWDYTCLALQNMWYYTAVTPESSWGTPPVDAAGNQSPSAPRHNPAWWNRGHNEEA